MSIQRKFLFAAASAVTMWTFIQSPWAQDSGIGNNPNPQSSMGTGAPATAASGASDKKADTAMAIESNPTPPTDADKKAAAAMGNSASTK